MRNLMPLVVLCALPVGVGGAAVIDWLGSYVPRYRSAVVAAIVLLLYALPARSAVELTAFQARTDSKVAAANFVRTLPRGQRIALELNPVEWAGDPIVEPVPFLTQHPLEWYRANNYRYLVANDSWRDQQDVPIYQEFKAGTTLLREFPGDRGGQPGPRIEVLDLGLHPRLLTIVRREALFGANLWLLGYEIQPGALRPAISPLEGADRRIIHHGDALQINLTWQTQQPLPYDYALFVHVLDQTGNVVAQRDTMLRQDEYPSSRWRPDEVVVERADLPLPALAPGTYTLKLGVYRMDSGERLPLAYPEPGSDSSEFVLTTIEVQE
jgi:hypothetical protein